jgi:hypothetical protein
MIIAAAEGIERANQLIGRVANLIPHVSKDDLADVAGRCPAVMRWLR